MALETIFISCEAVIVRRPSPILIASSLSVTPAALEVIEIFPVPVFAIVSVVASAPAFRVISPVASIKRLALLTVTLLVVATSMVPFDAFKSAEPPETLSLMSRLVAPVSVTRPVPWAETVSSIVREFAEVTMLIGPLSEAVATPVSPRRSAPPTINVSDSWI